MGADLFLELDDLLLHSERPSLRLEALRAEGALHEVPELLALPGVQQNPLYHPEGDVWIHTLMVVDEAVRERPADAEGARLLMWAALCHDLGKPLTTNLRDGRWRSPGHDLAGVKPTRALLSRLQAPEALIDPVCRLVHDHLAPHFFAEQRTSTAGIRRLLRRLGPLPLTLLVRLGRADSFGRTTEQARRREYPSGEWLLERVAGLPPEVVVTEPEVAPLLRGRDLLPLGFAPGPRLGRVLQRLYEAQQEGAFSDVAGGLAYLPALLLAEPELA